MSTIEQNSVVIIRGNTGCGKTTQVPQFILDHNIAIGTGAGCNIIVTQVRSLVGKEWSHRLMFCHTVIS